MLIGEKVTKSFGGLTALCEVDFQIGRGQVVGLIGPNGSGKTTLFNLISGFYRPDSGRIFFQGQEISKSPPFAIARMGIGRTFQLVRPFEELSVLHNIIVGVLYGTGESSVERATRKGLDILEFTGLQEKQHIRAGDLTLSERKRLEIARALSLSPQLILLDEVFAGLNPTESKQASDLVLRIRKDLGITVFLIEHVLPTVMATCERLMVLDFGVKIAEGKPGEIVAHPAVIEAYLGGVK